MTYPNGRVLTYDYGAANGKDDALSRVGSLIDDDVSSTHLADYSYLGLSSFVEVDYTEPDIKYTLVGTAGGNDPDTGDIYLGLDRFGRVKDSYWYDYGSSTDVDRIKYGYDRNGNRLWRENTIAASSSKDFDELYSYDLIDRLETMDRGDLNANQDAVTNKQFAQGWSLDAVGNWRNFREDGDGSGWDLDRQRIANKVNEITDIAETLGVSWVTPVYDRAGNMTTIPKPADPTASFAGTYDAWNRLVKIEEGANNVAQYEYDGTKRRTVKRTYSGGVLDETRYMYYTEPSKWQVVEERVDSGTDAERQFVWGMRYVDDIVERDRDTTGDGTLDEWLYGMQDGNWNVTTLADTGGNAVERYLYDPYGVLTVLDGSFGSRSSSSYDNSYTFTGRRLDAETGLYYYRNRHYSAELGWFVSRDPIGFEGSKSSIYATAISGPVLRGAPTRHFSIIPYNDDGAIVKNGLPAFCVRYDGCRMRVIVCFGWVICSVPGGSFERFELHTRMIPIINQCCWDWCDIGDRSMLMESCMETELRKFFPKVSCSSWPPNFS